MCIIVKEKTAAESTPKLLFGHDEPNTGRNNWTQSSDQGSLFTANEPHLYFGAEAPADYHKPSDSFENSEQQFYRNPVSVTLKCTLA